MANVVEVAVKRIKPDPGQPRTFINEEKVKEMALSMKTEGVIKPIELDKQNTIITGELRWRAAIKANLATVPCIYRDIKGRDRYRRQLIENLHNSSMSAIETAKALKKLLGRNSDAELAREIGANIVFVREHLDILNMNKEIQKNIKENKLPRTIIRAINIVPEKHREAFQKKLIKEQLGRDVAVHLSRSIHFHPDMAQHLLKRSYKGMPYLEVAKILDSEAPSVSEHLERSNEVEKKLHKHISAIIKWMAENNLEDVGPIYQSLIKQDFRRLSNNVGKWASKQKLLGNPDTKKLNEPR